MIHVCRLDPPVTSATSSLAADKEILLYLTHLTNTKYSETHYTMKKSLSHVL